MLQILRCHLAWSLQLPGGLCFRLTPGSPCVWVKLAGSVGSAGGGAEGVERCSCSINIPDRLRSRD